MAVDKQAVNRIAFLSRLKIEDGKIDAVQDEFNKILNWVEQLNEVNTDEVEPLSSVNDMALVCRDDKVVEGKQADKILASAPAAEYGYFVVPKVVE